jgi:hypothetical protein
VSRKLVTGRRVPDNQKEISFLGSMSYTYIYNHLKGDNPPGGRFCDCLDAPQKSTVFAAFAAFNKLATSATQCSARFTDDNKQIFIIFEGVKLVDLDHVFFFYWQRYENEFFSLFFTPGPVFIKPETRTLTNLL